MGIRKHNKGQLMLDDINVQTLIGMFDLVPNTLFWIKDEQCNQSSDLRGQSKEYETTLQGFDQAGFYYGGF